MKNKKAFTLVEVIAVLVVISIVLLIAIPSINSVLQDSKKKINEVNTKNLIQAAQNKYIEERKPMLFEIANNKFVGTEFPNYVGELPQSGTLKIGTTGEVAIATNDGEWCYIKDYDEDEMRVIEYEASTCNLTYSCGHDLFVDERDGKEYPTKKIGNQCWFLENLAYDCSNEAGYIKKTLIDPDDPISNWSTGNNCLTTNYFGLDDYLYQWNTAMLGSTIEENQGICPVGTHVPSDGEFQELEIFFGMDPTDAAINGWRGPASANDKMSNEWNGYLKGSYVQSSGYFGYNNPQGHWWTSSLLSANPTYRNMATGYDLVIKDDDQDVNYGMTVRCILD